MVKSAIAVASLILVGCGKGDIDPKSQSANAETAKTENATETKSKTDDVTNSKPVELAPESFASPQSIYKVYIDANQAGDLVTAFGCLSAECRVYRAATMARTSAMINNTNVMMKKDVVGKGLDEVLKSYGISLADEPKGHSSVDDSERIKFWFDQVSKLKEVDAFHADVVGFLLRQNPRLLSPGPLAERPLALEDVRIDGDQATATFVTTRRPYPMEFLRETGRWLVHDRREIESTKSTIQRLSEMEK